jgi:hypothetical protein
VLAQGVEGGQDDAVLEAAVLADGVDDAVDPRHVTGSVGGVGARDAREPQGRPFDGDRRVRGGDAHDWFRRPGGECARGRDDVGIQVQQGHHRTS